MSCQEIEVSVRDLALAFGIAPRNVSDLVDRGFAKRSERGRYLLIESTRLYTAHLRETASGRGGALEVKSLTDQRARFAAEQADNMALKNATLRGELVPASQVESEWSSILRGLRAKMVAVPSRVRQRLGHLTAHDIQVFDAEIRLALTETAHDDHAGGGSPPGSAQPDPSTEAEPLAVD